MAQEILFIPKQSDKVLFSCFHKLATDNNVRSITLTALGQSEIGHVPVVGEQPSAMKKLLDQDINLIQSASLNIEGLSLHFQRGGNTNDPSPHHDTIRISYNQQGNRPVLEVETRISIIATLVKDLRASIHIVQCKDPLKSRISYTRYTNRCSNGSKRQRPRLSRILVSTLRDFNHSSKKKKPRERKKLRNIRTHWTVIKSLRLSEFKTKNES